MARNTAEIVRQSGVSTDAEYELLNIPPARDEEEQTVLISVNGVNYRVPRGIPTKAPRFVAEEYRRAQAATRAMWEYSRQKEKEARQIRSL